MKGVSGSDEPAENYQMNECLTYKFSTLIDFHCSYLILIGCDGNTTPGSTRYSPPLVRRHVMVHSEFKLLWLVNTFPSVSKASGHKAMKLRIRCFLLLCFSSAFVKKNRLVSWQWEGSQMPVFNVFTHV